MNANVAADRKAYAALRASCKRHNAKRFDDLAADIVRELRDGEAATSRMWVEAARMICSGQDYA